MRARIAVLAALICLVAPVAAEASEGCFYKDATHSKDEFAWKAIQCWQYYHWWYPGSGVRTLTWINSTAARFQMTKGLQAKALVDWDPASGGVFPLPAGYWVSVY